MQKGVPLNTRVKLVDLEGLIRRQLLSMISNGTNRHFEYSWAFASVHYLIS